MADYEQAGVDVAEADRGIATIVEQIQTTWPTVGLGAVQLPIGYFANVVDIGGGTGLALCTDGVGSKTVLCDQFKSWRTSGIDCVAMNVNDIICVGAQPVSMTDYIAMGTVDTAILQDIAIGLKEGALQAGISICGGELSQLGGIVTGYDLVGSAVGIVPLHRINTGAGVEPGDVIIGIASNGLHSNGFTLVRKVLTGKDDLVLTLREELLRPTHIYVRTVRAILDLIEFRNIKALLHITGDGLLNLNRIARKDVGFVIDALPPVPPIFGVIQEYGQIDDAIMFQTFYMGIGFCIIVPPDFVRRVQHLIWIHSFQSHVIGHIIDDAKNEIQIPQFGLVGSGKTFKKVGA